MSKQTQRTRVGLRVYVYPRGKKGIYVADFHFKGTHKRESLHTTNKRTATTRAMKLENSLEEGTYGAVEIKDGQEQRMLANENRALVLLSLAASEFIEGKKVDGCRNKTLVKYQGILSKFQEFVKGLGVEHVGEVTLRHVDKYRGEQAKKLSHKSMHHEVSLLQQFFKWCRARRYCLADPLADQRYAKPKSQRRGGVLAVESVIAVINAAPTRMRGPLALIAATGMRSGECQRLRVEDIDFTNGWIHVRSRTGLPTKTGEDWKVPLHPGLRALLEALPRRRSGYYFTSLSSRKFPRGDHWINTKRLNESFQELLIELGLPAGRKKGGFSVHDLRHAFKSIAIAHGVPREYVDAWQGHSSINHASDLYVHSFDEISQQQIQKLPFTFNPPATDAGQP